jgi:hypothetical protein
VLTGTKGSVAAAEVVGCFTHQQHGSYAWCSAASVVKEQHSGKDFHQHKSNIALGREQRLGQHRRIF